MEKLSTLTFPLYHTVILGSQFCAQSFGIWYCNVCHVSCIAESGRKTIQNSDNDNICKCDSTE